MTSVSEDAAADAGVRPADIGVVELHDAFAPVALTNLEAVGLAEPGLAASRLMAGDFAGRGDGPALNPAGACSREGILPGRPAWAKWPRCCGICGGGRRPSTLGSRCRHVPDDGWNRLGAGDQCMRGWHPATRRCAVAAASTSAAPPGRAGPESARSRRCESQTTRNCEGV